MSERYKERAVPGPHVVNVASVDEVTHTRGEHWGGAYRPLTPGMGVGRLGVNQTRVPPGRASCPFHHHQREDEVFFVLEGRGVLRYGDTLTAIGPGDCISCPSGANVAHQIVNPYDEDLVYLAIGPHDPDEVCVYPDTGKVLVRSLNQVGRLEVTDYYDGEPDEPEALRLAREWLTRRG